MPRPQLRLVPPTAAPLDALDMWSIYWELRRKAAVLEAQDALAEAEQWRGIAERLMAAREKLEG